MNRILAPGAIDVWYCFTADPRLEDYQSQYEDILSDGERDQYEQFSEGDQRQEYLVGRALLRSVLAQYCHVQPQALAFGVNKFGKPELLRPAAPALQFNAAHTHGLTVCVVGNHYPVGIDTEYHSDSASLLKVAEDYFSSLELQALNEHSRDEDKLTDFFRYWTLKEAYLKARGEGLSIPLHDFSVVLEEHGFKEFLGPDAQDWDFRLLLHNQNYTAAVAMAGKITQLKQYNCVPLGPVSEYDPAAEQ